MAFPCVCFAAMLHVDYPMLFKVENKKNNKVTHCGVLEFVADEGMVYMPYWVSALFMRSTVSMMYSLGTAGSQMGFFPKWGDALLGFFGFQMMQNLLLAEGEIVNFMNATLPKGKFVKLQPHTKDFLDISNPKAVLERTLRNYSCLMIGAALSGEAPSSSTTDRNCPSGDTILVPYNNKNYYIDIIEAKPQDAVSIVETDCEVDFAPPLDYVEPEPVPREVPQTAEGMLLPHLKMVPVLCTSAI